MAVDLPADVVEELAAFDEVEIVTEDQEVKFLGFVEGATGAREMRGRTATAASKART